MIEKVAIKYAMRITLLQQQNTTEEKEFETIGSWSKMFTDTEKEYRSTEQECPSMVWGIRKLWL